MLLRDNLGSCSLLSLLLFYMYHAFDKLMTSQRWPLGLKRLRKVVKYIEDTTRWREDMNFMFEWQEQYLTSERSKRVRYCSCHENIKFISSSQRVMFFLLYGDKIKTNSTKGKGGNRDDVERYDTHKGDIRKIRHSESTSGLVPSKTLFSI